MATDRFTEDLTRTPPDAGVQTVLAGHEREVAAAISDGLLSATARELHARHGAASASPSSASTRSPGKALAPARAIAATRRCVLCGEPLRGGQHLIRIHGSTIHARCHGTTSALRG